MESNSRQLLADDCHNKERQTQRAPDQTPVSERQQSGLLLQQIAVMILFVLQVAAFPTRNPKALDRVVVNRTPRTGLTSPDRLFHRANQEEKVSKRRECRLQGRKPYTGWSSDWHTLAEDRELNATQ